MGSDSTRRRFANRAGLNENPGEVSEQQLNVERKTVRKLGIRGSRSGTSEDVLAPGESPMDEQRRKFQEVKSTILTTQQQANRLATASGSITGAAEKISGRLTSKDRGRLSALLERIRTRAATIADKRRQPGRAQTVLTERPSSTLLG